MTEGNGWHPLVAPVAALAVLSKWAFELGLEELNRRHVLAHADAVPAAHQEVVDPATYAKSVRYTLAKSRLNQAEDTVRVGWLLMILFSGVLPWSHAALTHRLGDSSGVSAAFLFAVGLALVLPLLPFGWYAQFRLEARFGFNTTTRRTWCLDRLKGFWLAAVLGYPLLVLVLKLVDWTGGWWWLWAWAAITGFQLALTWLAPVLILPLFNQFTPLGPGTLRERLLALAARTDFPAKDVQVMDGSRRSRHSNAFFTGFGRFRRIVLFDTLLAQLTEPQVEAVLAHEIGHFRRRHVPKLMAWSATSLLAGLGVTAWLAQQAWFGEAFGFSPGPVAPALLLCALLGGTVTFWTSPLLNRWSRRFEYEADAFSAQAMGEAASLVGALRKLTEQNLANLTPHPWFSRFYYSHPTLLEREQHLATPPPGLDRGSG
jgi:STE24 endopeptidase